MKSPGNGSDHSRQQGKNDDPTVVDWSPSGVLTSMWVALGIMLGMLGFFFFGLAYVLIGVAPAGDTLDFNPLLVAVLSVAILVAHQLLHAAVAKLHGGSPAFVLDVVQLIFPVMYVRTDGQHFSRTQFITYVISPLVLLSLAGVLAMVIHSGGAMLIIPLAINSGLSTRDLWMGWIAWQQPGDSLIETHGSGLRIIRPL